MKNPRIYGNAPFSIAVIHGGPGAAGEMAPVARELALSRGILEPLQTATSLEGQVAELKTVLEQSGKPPITLIGFSWGAWLSFICAAQYPTIIRKLVLIGSGSFEEQYAADIHETRLSRLSEPEREGITSLLVTLNDPSTGDKNTPFARLGKLFTRADAYNPLPVDDEYLDIQYHIYQNVWNDASEMRKSGKLLELGQRIQCPVVAIHGDYDPHPAEGVQKPLSSVLKSFRFILLKNCGHKPWIEREARDKFYEILREELD